MVPRLKRKELITNARREQILKAALSVFSSKGFGGSTMADIAQAAGVSMGTLYNYYKNKRDLLISAMKEIAAFENLINIITTTKNPHELMDSVLQDRLEMAFSNGQNLLFFYFEILQDDKFRRQYIEQVLLPLFSGMEDYIRSNVKSGVFRKVDERIIARTLIGAVMGNMILHMLERRNSPFKKAYIREIAREMTAMFIDGLAIR